jgi:hypothetical protein
MFVKIGKATRSRGSSAALAIRPERNHWLAMPLIFSNDRVGISRNIVLKQNFIAAHRSV